MMNLLLAICLAIGPGPTSEALGQAADIAPSAYQYRADRKPSANPPESWLALMHAAGLPLNKPVDLKNPAMKRVLCGLLWEEIRPVQTLELTWPSNARRRPRPADLAISALINQGASSSWWNNLASISQPATPTVSSDGRTYTYAIGQNTCGLVVSAAGDFEASKFDVPQVRVLVADTWKQMDLEIEWGFDQPNANRDYSGRVETYDGRASDLKPLDNDDRTVVGTDQSWQSQGEIQSRRGVKMSLLYIGASKWRKRQEYTTQRDDVARTIVTVWTKSGSFSFLAADLENGPILAPEYGFFVRRTSAAPLSTAKPAIHVVPVPMTTRMDSIAGNREFQGWGSSETPWFGSNPTGHTVSVSGIVIPAKAAAMHPGQFVDVAAEWTSPTTGDFQLKGTLTHAQAGGNGVEWWVARDSAAGREVLAYGKTNGAGSYAISGDRLARVAVERGDRILLIVGPKGDHRCDTTIVDWTISEAGGQRRVWNLAHDVAESPTSSNPHGDSLGNSNVWRFCSEMPMLLSSPFPSDPPIPLASSATSGKAFEQELRLRSLKTVREQTRSHEEQTWEGAVTATRGSDLPAISAPPVGNEPPMQVQVPSDRLTAQWNLGTWHLLRHCATNPKTGKPWFNDYPYGILAAETYLVLSVLDQMGSHQAAEAGFDQWTMLPFDRNTLPDHPVGLFSEGHGSMTYAEGPPGAGGHMDGIHAFGPGSIGWALTQHYWMTGDVAWLKANAARIKANAEWMLRQRRLNSGMVPGGDRLWCKGLQPALQVTPDSGGLWMQFYECEAYYWASINRLAETLAVVDPVGGAKLRSEAEAYRKDLKAAVERSIALSPVVPVRDGTFHSVIPFACYARGPATGAWGWQRDGSGSHVGPLYWDTVQTAAALISPAGLLSPKDVRVQGYFDVLEDRFLFENQNASDRDWFERGWQYQGGLERTANMHLAADDIPVFLRSFLNCYAVDILPKDGYVFNEHAVHGPPDKIFEEAAFLERFRNLLVMEDGDNLWLARGTPRAWLEQGKRISVKHAPTHFGDVDYEIVSDLDNGKINAYLTVPARLPAKEIWLRLRHPKALPMVSVQVNGKSWKDFDATKEVIKLDNLEGVVTVEVRYQPTARLLRTGS